MAEKKLEQNIEHIKLDDLILWSGNPREPDTEGVASDDIIKMALEDANEKWDLKKLHNDMFSGDVLEQTSSIVSSEIGKHYDISELPTVVKRGSKYIVYDGNRRIALIKYLQNREVFPETNNYLSKIDVPENIKNLLTLPCNVCNEETALENVQRKHGKTGSWTELNKDYFFAKYRDQPKSPLLMIEEATGLISKNKELNQPLVKKSILTADNLNSIGFGFKDGKLQSVYTENDAKIVLEKLGKLIITKEITGGEFAPGMLGKILPKISNDLKDKIKSTDASGEFLKYVGNLKLGKISISPKTTEPKIFMFPEELYLEEGDVNDIYRDIKMIDENYQKSKNKFTLNFPRILRLSLRILAEAASKSANTNGLVEYTEKHFEGARKALSKDSKNRLSGNDITQGELSRLLRESGHYNRDDLDKGSKKITELLQTGAHDYTDATDYKTVCTMSIIIGAMLQISHGKKQTMLD